MSEDLSLSVVNHYQCQLNSDGVIEGCSLEGKVIAENSRTGTTVKELSMHLAVPNKNITTNVKFENLVTGGSYEKELMSIKLGPKDNVPPVIVTELVTTVGNPEENYRVVYPERENHIIDRFCVKNQGDVIIPKIRISKDVESFGNILENQIRTEAGKVTLNQRAIVWDIDNLSPGQSLILTIDANINVGANLPPTIGWVSLIYEMPSPKEKNNTWIVKKIDSEIFPKILEQILYDLAIPESRFEMAKIMASRAILSVQLKSPGIVETQFECVLKNNGTVTLDNIEIIHQFPKVVELPNASEVSLALRGIQVSKTNFEVNQSPCDKIADCTIFRIFLRNMTSTIGGLQGGEEVRVVFPAFVGINFEQGILNYPTFFNAQVKPGTPLIEATVTDAKVDKSVVKINEDTPNVKSSGPQSSFEAEVIAKFSAFAVDAYNARKYEDALAYCEQILSVAQKIGNKPMTQNFITIAEKLKKIIAKKILEKSK